MDFNSVVATLNTLLTRNQPAVFNSSWIRKNAPQCYRFIQRNLRREFGGINWDQVTYALDRKFQRRWVPGRLKKNSVSYEDPGEVDAILKRYQGKMYVFISPSNEHDRWMREVIGISLVRLAQNGNLLAQEQLIGLIKYTIDEWVERHYFLSRWQGYEEELKKQLEACVRRYRYTGSFLRYVFRTLEYAGRGIRPRQFDPSDHHLSAGCAATVAPYCYFKILSEARRLVGSLLIPGFLF